MTSYEVKHFFSKADYNGSKKGRFSSVAKACEVAENNFFRCRHMPIKIEIWQNDCKLLTRSYCSDSYLIRKSAAVRELLDRMEESDFDQISDFDDVCGIWGVDPDDIINALM